MISWSANILIVQVSYSINTLLDCEVGVFVMVQGLHVLALLAEGL